MKRLVARNQIRLGPARAFELALSGMRFRLFRSGVTIAILALAVAFLAHTASHGMIGAAVRGAALDQLERDRALGQYLTRFTTPDPAPLVRRTLAEAEPARLAEYQGWGGLTGAELHAAMDAARALQALALELDRLPPAARAVVLADEAPTEVVEGLVTTAAAESLLTRLARAGAHLPGAERPQLLHLATVGRPALDEVVRRVSAGQEQAVRALAAAYPERALREVAARPPADFAARLRAVGFAISDAEAAALAAFAAKREDLRRIASTLLEAETRAIVARELRVPVGDVGLEVVAKTVSGERRLAWFAGVLRDAGAGAQFDSARVEALLAGYRREQRLSAAVGGDVAGGARREAPLLGGLPVRTLVLVALSFLVCVVGVANAMLMSVTERFTEIATMKCLGGLDGFIMALFVFEAILSGLLGGVLGGMVGLGLAILRGTVEYGSLVLTATSATGSVLGAVCAAGVTGVVLAAAAAIGPAWLAARLAPMEAMRVD